MEADDAHEDPYPSAIEVEPDPDRVPRGASLAVAGLGGVTLVAVAGSTLAAIALAPVRAALAAPLVAVLVVGLMSVAFLAGAGLLATGLLLYHSVNTRRVAALTHEGLVEETSQEFDKVNARMELVEESVGALEKRFHDHVRRIDGVRRDARVDPKASSGPEPVAVNILSRGRRRDPGDVGSPPGDT